MAESDDDFKKPAFQPIKSNLKPVVDRGVMIEKTINDDDDDDDEIQFLDALYKKGTFQNEIIVLENSPPKNDHISFNKPTISENFQNKKILKNNETSLNESAFAFNKSNASTLQSTNDVNKLIFLISVVVNA